MEPDRTSLDALASNRERLARLFDDHYDNVYRFCLARSGSPELADEICGEAFAEAARWFAQDRAEAISVGWLLTVARRRLVDHWRSETRRRQRIERIAMEAQLPDESDDSSDAVFEALQSLSTRQRAALTLRYIDDYSVSEVAEALEVGYSAAESLLARARRSFTEAWEGSS